VFYFFSASVPLRVRAIEGGKQTLDEDDDCSASGGRQ